MKQSDRNKLLTELEGAELLKEVAQHFRDGMAQKDIGKLYGVNQSTIHTWLVKVRVHWLNSAVRNWDELKALELAEIARTEQAAWRGWERSLLPKKSINKRTIGTLQGEDVQNSPVKTRKNQPVELNVRKEDGTGDPRFLAIVMKCIERRCAILGLDAPTKLEGNVSVNWRDEFQQQGKDGDQFMMVVMQLAAVLIDKPPELVGEIIEGIARKVKAE